MQDSPNGTAIETEHNGSVPNGTVIDVGNGRGGVVQQGPEWLAKLVYAPPEWVVYSLYVGIAIALVALALLYRRAEIEDPTELLEEYAQLVLVIFCTVGGTLVLTEYAAAPYWIDVLGGSTMGYCVSQAILRGVPRVLPGEAAASAGSKD